MEILRVSIDWMDRYANNPHMTIEVDEIPADLKYRAYPLEGKTFYIAVKRNYVSFMIHSPSRETGYGGRKFQLQLVDNTEVEIKGPWSSNCTVAYDLAGVECADVTLLHDNCRYSGHVTSGFFKEAILWYNEHVHEREAKLVIIDDYDRHYLELAKMLPNPPAEVNI